MTQKHENYEILNLIGYGLAKFDKQLVKQFGFKTKTDFYEFLVSKNVADTSGTVKNRQDLFDHLFPENPRRGWWQKGDTYKHRRILIDNLFGEEDVVSFANIIKGHLRESFDVFDFNPIIKPITKSKYRKMQETGREAEEYFLNNFNLLSCFDCGSIIDARLYGDGYDFEVDFPDNSFKLVEVKGVREITGNIRLSQNEFSKANEYKDEFYVVVVFNLIEKPQFSVLPNPIQNLNFTPKPNNPKPTIDYFSDTIKWQPWNNDLNG